MKRYILTIAAVLAGISSWAQQLDPTVTVTKAYEGKTIQASKPFMELTVPDSLKYFDLQFDYSVFDNPYKGAYEFNPYLMEIRPQADAFHGNQFYLRAGMGYALQPTLDVIWSPVFKQKKFKMSLYASYDSYIGEYRNISYHPLEAGKGDLTWARKEQKWNGYDMLAEGGINGRVDGKKAVFTFDAGYYGIHTSQMLPYSTGFDLKPFSKKQRRSYNAVKAGMDLYSKDNSVRNIVYRVALDYLFSVEGSGGTIEYAPSKTGLINAHEFEVAATFTKGFRKNGGFCMDVNYDMAIIGGLDKTGAIVSAVPKYILRRSKFTLDAGVRIDVPVVKKNMISATGQIVYPELNMRYSPFGKYFNIDLSVTGGDRLNSYGDMIARDHHFSGMYTKSPAVMHLLDATNEIVGCKLAFSGEFKKGFRYSLEGGYHDYRLLPHYGVFAVLDSKKELLAAAPVMNYTSARGFYAEAKLGWQNEAWDVGGFFRYSGIDDGNPLTFNDPEFSSSIHLRYNWMKRIFAGITCDYVSAREAVFSSLDAEGRYISNPEFPELLRIPYFVDLSIDLEYRFNRTFSVWLSGGNLANMTIQKVPVYSEPGINFTAGICLKF